MRRMPSGGRRRAGGRAASLSALALTAVAALALAGCSGENVGDGAGEPTEDAAAASGPTTPVIAENFPDPEVLETDDGYYAYSTESNRQNMPVAFSEDLVEWEMVGDGMPTLPSWIIPGKTWAPEVTELEPGRYAAYFTATNFQPTFQCVGVAIASDPAGPFEVQGDGMLVCPPEEGGAIDATTVLVDDVWHLVWKNDGNAIGVDTWIQSAPLTADGLALAGEPVRMLQQDQPWEGELIEAPTVVERDGELTLLYSANSYGGDEYAMGYATAPAIEGPWTKAEGPWVSTASTGDRVRGPGGQDVVTGPDGADRLVFHGWDPSYTYRMLYIAPLEWDGTTPIVSFD